MAQQHQHVPQSEVNRQASFVWQQVPDSDWMTKKEVAQHARVSEDTIEKLVRNGILEAYRLGGGGHLRFKRADVDARLFSKVEPSKTK
jgi:excisionase family DNA binding protein